MVSFFMEKEKTVEAALAASHLSWRCSFPWKCPIVSCDILQSASSPDALQSAFLHATNCKVRSTLSRNNIFMRYTRETLATHNLVPRVLSNSRKYFLEVEKGPWERGCRDTLKVHSVLTLWQWSAKLPRAFSGPKWNEIDMTCFFIHCSAKQFFL